MERASGSAAARRELAVLLIASLAVFSANMHRLSLISVDDAFYARKGIEAERSGRFFTLTWDEHPNFHKPPLQFWLIGRTFALFGENDFAARLPSVVMGLGVVAMTYRIGVLTASPAAALTGVALLVLSPYFSDHARRVMLDVPLTFWTTLAMLIFLEGRQRPRLTALIALPVAAALLTKSVLGLVPILVILASAAVVPALRPLLRTPWMWVGITGGLILGASWTIHQGWSYGAAALKEHYLGEVGSRAALAASPLAFLYRYPWVLLDSYQPVIVPAVLGAIMLWRNRDARGEIGLVLPVWAFLPVLVLNFLSGRSPRYIFQIFPALALCGGVWLARVAPAITLALRRWIAPVVLAVAALILWVVPGVLDPLLQSSGDPNRDIKRSRLLLQELIPAQERVAFVGAQYWSKASPLLYYVERRLEWPGPTVDQAVARAARRPSRLLLCDRSRLGDIDSKTLPYQVVFESRHWVLLRLLL